MPYSALDELAEYSAREVSGVERARPERQRTIADRLQHLTGPPVQTVRVRTTVQEERARRQARQEVEDGETEICPHFLSHCAARASSAGKPLLVCSTRMLDGEKGDAQFIICSYDSHGFPMDTA